MKRILVITLTLLMLLSVVTLTGCDSVEPSKESKASTSEVDNSKIGTPRFIYIDSVYDDSAIFPGDRLGTTYYDRYTKVVYIWAKNSSFTPLYNSDGTPLLYDDWLEQELEDISDVSE